MGNLYKDRREVIVKSLIYTVYISYSFVEISLYVFIYMNKRFIQFVRLLTLVSIVIKVISLLQLRLFVTHFLVHRNFYNKS